MCRVLLIAASRGAHEVLTRRSRWVDLLSCPTAGSRIPRGLRADPGPVGRLLAKEPADPAGVEWSGDSKSPAERSTALRGVQTPLIGMQPRSPSGETAPWIGDNEPVHGDDAEQFGDPFPDPAADAHPHRTTRFGEGGRRISGSRDRGTGRHGSLPPCGSGG